jgi:tripartite-type tricarboxylate transporter receptor subunit TctC
LQWQRKRWIRIHWRTRCEDGNHHELSTDAQEAMQVIPINIQWPRGRHSARSCVLAPIMFALTAAPAQAQVPEQTLASKTVTIYIGYGPGGGYDLYGRVLARHLGKHLPGRPTVVASNMPGAASIRAANYVYNVAPKDGTALGIVAQSIGEEQLLGNAGVSYDVAKFNWIGRFAANVEVSYTWHTSPVKALDDLKRTEARFAGTGPSSSIYPRLLNGIAGMKWKVIMGYNTTVEAHLAMQRGEVDGATSSLNTLKTREAEWLSRNLINILIQYAPRRSPELAAVPAVVELGTTQEDKDVLGFYASSSAVGRSVIAPPDMAAERVRMLRAAFDATLKDREFLAEIETTKLDFEPMAGAELQTLLESSTHVSSVVLERARAARAE